MKEIYMVTEEWQNQDCEGGVKIHSFSTYEKAKKFFDACIKDDKETGLSSVSFENNDVELADEVFYEEKWKEKSYVLETSDNPNDERYLHNWEWFEKGFYSTCHSCYTLQKLTIDEDEIKTQEGGD